jgi:hypothetical protein
MPSNDGTGLVSIEEHEGTWWFSGPTGERFLSLGVNHIEPHLWMGAYNMEHTIAQYGSDFVLPNGRFNPDGSAAAAWINNLVEVCKSLGFNTFAKHTHPAIPSQLYQDQIYYVASLETAPLGHWRQAKGESPMPDVFSTDFEHHLAEKVRLACEEHSGSPNLLGYLYVDVPLWETNQTPGSREDDVMIYPWVNAIVRLAEYAPGKRAWIEHLKGRYADAEAAARSWGVTISRAYGSSWEYLSRLNTWFHPADRDRARDDLSAFMGKIAERWYGLHHDEIRKHDPDHLILGDKSRVDTFRDWLVPALKKYVDVVLIQSYNQFGKDREMTDWIYEQTGKPILNGDGSFGYPNPHQQKYSVKGFRSNAQNVEEVAGMYRRYMEEILSTPYFVGWHHCGFLEQWDESERGDVNSNENGFLDPFGNEYTAWTDVIRDTNSRASDLHDNAVPIKRPRT